MVGDDGKGQGPEREKQRQDTEHEHEHGKRVHTTNCESPPLPGHSLTAVSPLARPGSARARITWLGFVETGVMCLAGAYRQLMS